MAPRVAHPFVLAGVVVVAAVLRLIGLDVQSMWHDELFVAYASASDTLWDAINIGAIADVHPPAYIVLAYGWIGLFGDTAVSMRLPSALAGIAAVPWLARLGTLWVSPRVGAIAAALAAVSWMPIYYSQEARPYALLFLGTIALAERISTYERRGHTAPALVGVIAATTIGLAYLHYFGTLFAVCALVVWGIHRRRGGRDLVSVSVVAAATFVTFLPWALTLLAHVDHGESWMLRPGPRDVWDLYGAMANGSTVGMIVLVIVSVATREGVVPALLAWAIVPVGVAVAASWTILPVVSDRNLIIVLPALLLLGALALDSLDQRFRAPLASVVVCGWLLFDLFVTRDYYRQPTKWQYREVAETIVRQTPPGATPFVYSGAWHPNYFDGYFRRLGSDIRVTASGSKPADVAQALSQTDVPLRFVAIAVPGTRRARGALRVEGFEAVNVWSFVGWDLYHFVPSDVGAP